MSTSRPLSARRSLYASASDLPGRLLFKLWPSVRGNNDPDIVQAGHLGLWLATACYDEGKGNFRNYAATVALHAMVREAKRLRGIVRRDNLASGWMRPVPGDVEIQLDYSTREAVDPMEPDTSSWLLRRLHESDRDILRRAVIHEQSGEEIGQRYGVTKQRIHARKKEILFRLRAAVEGEAA